MPNILIVEDDLTIADMLQEVLENRGLSVCAVARTVASALLAAQRYKPDHAIIDLHLADGGLGTDLAERLRGLTDIRIIFSTGNDNAGLTKRFGDAVMTKPYRLADMAVGLAIVDDIASSGRTSLPFPRNFRLLMPQDAPLEDVATDLQ